MGGWWGDLVGFRVRVKIKTSLGTGSLVPVGGGKATSISYPFFLASWAASSATKTSPNAGYFKISLNKLLFFFSLEIFLVLTVL